MAKAASALDYRDLARRRLPRFLFEYIDGGSYAEATLRLLNNLYPQGEPRPGDWFKTVR